MKVLGEPLRWEIVRRLAVEDLCTCHLVEDMGATQPLVSHHLRVLREAGVVHADKAGAFTYYVLNREVVGGLSESLAHLGAEPAGRRRRPCT